MNATHALGWALVHFLWQGSALALLLGVGLSLTRKAGAQTRYTLSLIALAAMLILPLATGMSLYDPPTSASTVTTVSTASDVVEASSPAPSPLQLVIGSWPFKAQKMNFGQLVKMNPPNLGNVPVQESLPWWPSRSDLGQRAVKRDQDIARNQSLLSEFI